MVENKKKDLELKIFDLDVKCDLEQKEMLNKIENEEDEEVKKQLQAKYEEMKISNQKSIKNQKR